MLAVDAAEAEGDAERALALVDDMALGPDGRPWWRPQRVRRLRQLVTLGDDAPTWAIQRWVVAQAAQSPVARPQEAAEVAIRVRGGRSTLWGVDDSDAMAKVADHDWVYRQLVVHEHGGLVSFVQGTARPRLLVRAGDMASWIGTPMGGYEFLAETDNRIVWRDLASGETFESLNLGAAAMMALGEAVIGRLVRSGDVLLFESAPLCVPIDLARDVSMNPSAWLEALTRGCRGKQGWLVSELVAKLHHFDLLFDLPTRLRRQLIEPADPDLRPDTLGSGGNGVEYDVALVLAALAGDLGRADDEEACECGQCEDVRPLGALVSAALLEPETLEAVTPLLVTSDAEMLERLEATLVAPADVLCRRLRARLGHVA